MQKNSKLFFFSQVVIQIFFQSALSYSWLLFSLKWGCDGFGVFYFLLFEYSFQAWLPITSLHENFNRAHARIPHFLRKTFSFQWLSMQLSHARSQIYQAPGTGLVGFREDCITVRCCWALSTGGEFSWSLWCTQDDKQFTLLNLC